MNCTAPHFTQLNAKEMAARSVAARRAKREALQDRALEAESLAKALAERVKDQPLNAKVFRIEAQLARLDQILDESEDYKEINALTQAKERLLNAWALLTGFPKPGVRRQSKGRATLPDLAPIAPTPVSPVPSQDPLEPNG